ncbi:MAG: hypothetical protein K9J16_14900 [Melioribacteraceae bacterium]|nr:hypothetical protein [Melioribacteraceae bacterium]MCF8356247.1 hypothetical protein [Melioribacteraceae bacterium]MCF8395433.1 hypothetical protein [Melioribacteraceae bacterium]MCF8420768.1 hypothetical protein [Melioribacteraceae bacterium]
MIYKITGYLEASTGRLDSKVLCRKCREVRRFVGDENPPAGRQDIRPLQFAKLTCQSSG